MAISRTTIRLEAGLLRDAKKLAAETGRTLTSVIEDALREVVNRRAAAPASREKFELPTWGDGGLLPGVDISNGADLQERDDLEKWEKLEKQNR